MKKPFMYFSIGYCNKCSTNTQFSIFRTGRVCNKCGEHTPDKPVKYSRIRWYYAFSAILLAYIIVWGVFFFLLSYMF